MSETTNAPPDVLVIRGKTIQRQLPSIEGESADPDRESAKVFRKLIEHRELAMSGAERWLVALKQHHGSLWEVDRTAEMIKIAKKLRTRPDEAVPQLLATLQGCRFLHGRWLYLRQVVTDSDFPGQFLDVDRNFALELEGVPPQRRELRHPTEPRLGTTRELSQDNHKAYVERRIAELELLIEAHTRTNQAQRELAATMPELFPDVTLKKFQQEISRCERELLSIWRTAQKGIAAKADPNETMRARPEVTRLLVASCQSALPKTVVAKKPVTTWTAPPCDDPNLILGAEAAAPQLIEPGAEERRF